MKHTIKKATLVLLITAGMISCSKGKEIVSLDQTSVSEQVNPPETLPTFPPPKKKTSTLTVE